MTLLLYDGVSIFGRIMGGHWGRACEGVSQHRCIFVCVVIGSFMCCINYESVLGTKLLGSREPFASLGYGRKKVQVISVVARTCSRAVITETICISIRYFLHSTAVTLDNNASI